MGQTLTHGVYLPDEGERNCYSGLAGNWQILDTSVGTIAEHTSALSGKAPLVHTHTKSDITDFPALANVATSGSYNDLSNIPASFTPASHSHGNITNDGKVGTTANKPLITGTGGVVQAGTFGNAANTFCEGNDSRLSDARTPVAHTHGKADITDLFNSANTWAENNTYSKTVVIERNTDIGYFLALKNSVAELGSTPASATPATIGYSDKNNDKLGYMGMFYNTDGSNHFRLFVRNKFTSRSPSTSGTVDYATFQLKLNADQSKEGILRASFRPYENNTYDLGSSSYQWNNLYAKNYYYNGVAWGLDKANVWSANNQFAKINTIETNTVEWHNSHYRGINLISDGHFANMAALLTAIRNQDWSDIYIGDYVELTFTYEGASRTVKFYVGEIDKFYKVGNTSLETHHLVMVTGDLGINQVMNDTNTTAGGYVGSKAHTVTLPALYAILNPLFNNAILTHREHLSNTVLSAQTVSLSLDDGNGAVTYSCNNFPVYSSGDPNTPGCVTVGNWYDCNLVLMSEIEMFGSNRFASSGIDDIMCPEGQIAAFKYNRNLQTLNRTINTWLRNVNSSFRFCICGYYGASGRYGASSTFIRLRPRFLIG